MSLDAVHEIDRGEPDVEILVLGARRSAELKDFLQVIFSSENEATMNKHRHSSYDQFTSADTATDLLCNSQHPSNNTTSSEIILNWDANNRPYDGRRSRGGRSDHVDVSQWFNYGFSEQSFKDWVSWQLTMRKQKLAELQQLDQS